MRTGTTWLSSLLGSHPDIDCRGELLHHMRYRGTPAASKKYLDDTIFEISSAPVRGFKLLYHQMRGPESTGSYIFAHLLRDVYNCKVIHVKRGDLDTYISQCLGRVSGIWNVFPEDDIVMSLSQETIGVDEAIDRYNKPITIDIEHYRTFCRQMHYWQKKTEDIFPDHVVVNYNDLPNVDSALEYLGVPVVPIESKTVRLRRLPLEQIVSNYDELV